jgi:Flp pilus assembly pilin Flp
MDEDQLTMHAPGRFLTGERGATAVEFALVLPGLLFVLFGTINVFLMTYAWINLTSSAEQAARYAAVSYHASCTPPGSASNCTYLTSTAVSTYANSRYIGPTLTKTYTYSTTGACGPGGNTGHSVSASATYRAYYGFGTINFPLGGAACFP